MGLRRTRPTDDWNQWWYEKFEGYREIPALIESAVELGCGPYTNIRLIRKDRVIESVICNDPLMNRYLQLGGNWVAIESAKGNILLDDHPIEERPFSDETFDLVIMINVLDHVMDAMLCLDVAVGITKPAGYLVLGQDLSDQRDVAQSGNDVAHPIRIHHHDIDQRVFMQFSPRFKKLLPREEGRNPGAHYGTYLLIGQKGRF